MPYKAATPTYEAVRWDGTNVEECHEFHLQWFPQPPPPREGYSWTPPFMHDADTNTLVVAPGFTLAVGDYLVNGGTYPPDQVWAGNPEGISATSFPIKYPEQV